MCSIMQGVIKMNRWKVGERARVTDVCGCEKMASVKEISYTS